MLSVAFIINVITTLLLVGITWFMQIVFFPLLRFYDTDKPDVFARTYRDRMMLLTFPLMSLEFLTGVTIMLAYAMVPKETEAAFRSYIIFGIAFLCMAINLLITFQMIRPLSRKFLEKPTLLVLKKLEQWNWVRTIIWTLRFLLLISTIFSR